MARSGWERKRIGLRVGPREEERHEVSGWVHPGCPGLAVTPALDANYAMRNFKIIRGQYKVTHAGSGYSITEGRHVHEFDRQLDLEEARVSAMAIAGILDWTQDDKTLTEVLAKNEALRDRLTTAAKYAVHELWAARDSA